MIYKKAIVSTLVGLLTVSGLWAQEGNLIGNMPGRTTRLLDGQWQYIVDQYETGFYDYRFKERYPADPEAYWNTDIPANKGDRKEHGYTDTHTLRVPGDWNSQKDLFLYYEGTVWYKRAFDYRKKSASNKLFIYFGAVNYRADVYLNGHKLGSHKGGFTPFNFEIADSVLKATGNFLVVKVDNKRYAQEIPTLNTDWWNYGGITRSVSLVELPATSIQNYSLQLTKSAPHPSSLEGWVQVANAQPGQQVQVEIPELGIKAAFPVEQGKALITLQAKAMRYWSPGDPRLYRVIFSTGTDHTEEKIGFRTIATQGNQLLLNGKPLFMRGISIHEEIPQERRRAYSKADALQLLGWAKELGCNMVRLAHYPHDETMTRMADSLGLLVWSEIPIYWTIDFTSPEVLEKAKVQLHEMISRDINRASIVIWSVGNETPVSEARTGFMHSLLDAARAQDPSRLVSAALEVTYNSGRDMHVVDDPLGQYVDLVAFNEYLGWYSGTPASCRTTNWSTIYDKPFFISETGAEALGGYHADSATVWSEEFQAWYYREQLSMLERMPANFVGLSPWILADFRSPRRNNPHFQDGWNNKGLIDHKGNKKKAFYLLRAYYRKVKDRQYTHTVKLPDK